MKTHADMTFDEFVEDCTRRIHSSLLKGGGEEMRKEVYVCIVNGLQRERDIENIAKAKKKRK